MLTKADIDKFYKDLDSLDVKFPVAVISEKTGYNKGNVSQIINRKLSPSENFIEAFYKSFKNVPRITSMVEEPETYLEKRNHKKTTGKRSVPLYDAPASAGITEAEMPPIAAPAGTIDVGDLLHDSQAAIRIYGNSMIPNYPPGCVVGLTPCKINYIIDHLSITFIISSMA